MAVITVMSSLTIIYVAYAHSNCNSMCRDFESIISELCNNESQLMQEYKIVVWFQASAFQLLMNDVHYYQLRT